MVLPGRLGLETARIPHADRHGLLYLARGQLYVEDGTLRFRTAGFDDVPAGDYAIPFQMVSLVLLGPGGNITHDSLRLLARHGTGFVAVAEGGVRLYASLPQAPDDSALARRQARCWADPEVRVAIARRMYAWRFGEILPHADMDTLRGIEGGRVKEAYRLMAKRYRIDWNARRYDRSRPEAADVPNQAINHAATAVEAAAMVACTAAGAIPQLGFVHEDPGVAFALDIADLYRMEVTLDAAFWAARRHLDDPSQTLERLVRRRCAELFRRRKLVPEMIDRIKALFDMGEDRWS